MPKEPIIENADVRPKLSDVDIQKQAARWVSVFDDADADDRDVDEATAAEFESWLRADPRHADEYEFQSNIVIIGRNLPEDVREGLRASTYARIHRRAALRRMFSLPRLALAAGTVALVLAFAYVEFGMPTRSGALNPTLYSTKTAEARSIHLSDGSDIELNSRTQIQWSLDDRGRRVDLLSGEVYIDTARDLRRPFRVRVGQSEIRVLGTRFNVYKKPDSVVLTVIEGTVEVVGFKVDDSKPTWVKRVSAARTVEYRASGVLEEDTDSTDAQKWREGVILFRKKPLAEAVQELRRYTDRPIVFDARLTHVSVTGIYKTRDVRGDFTLMAQQGPMTVHDDGKVISLRFKDQEISPVR